MARLRVRVELNRGGAGVPLEKLANLVDEAQKFFRMLAEDVHIGKDGGEWMGFDFHPSSLNFTAEFVGQVAPAQVSEFQAAFDGVTLLRRATIAQFARIAGAIEEDELIGFGLYQNDQETQPGEWRSLSKREALRIGEEIRLLSRIPAGLDPKAAASLFQNRREPAVGERGIEALAQRVDRLENHVSSHTEEIRNLRGAGVNTEQNLQKLLTAVDSFCDRATRQMERLPSPESQPGDFRKFGWRIPVTVAAVCAIAALLLFRGGNESRDAADRVQAARPAETSAPVAAPVTTPPAVATPPEQKIELKAIEPTWVAAHIDGKLEFSRLLDTDQTKTIETAGTVRVRLGNAGGVQITVNGATMDEIGRKGQVRTIEFTGGASRVVAPPIAAK